RSITIGSAADPRDRVENGPGRFRGGGAADGSAGWAAVDRDRGGHRMVGRGGIHAVHGQSAVWSGAVRRGGVLHCAIGARRSGNAGVLCSGASSYTRGSLNRPPPRVKVAERRPRSLTTVPDIALRQGEDCWPLRGLWRPN